jgi:hypothetical protein
VSSAPDVGRRTSQIGPNTRNRRYHIDTHPSVSQKLCVFQAGPAIEPGDLSKSLMTEAALMIIEGVNDYFLCSARIGVIRRLHR